MDYPVSENLRFWLIAIVALAAITTTLLLGRWQLSRAAQKESLQAAMEVQSRRNPLTNVELVQAAESSLSIHRLARLRGSWVPARTVFLDNRQMNAKPGFYVVTPLMLDGTNAAVLVQRGWVARNFVDRSRVPSVPTPAGLVELEGRIAPPPSKLYELGDDQGGPIRQNLDLALFKKESGLPLLAVSVQQTGPNGEGLLREWWVGSSGADKNYGYAVQWFGLSTLITVLYVWFQIGKRYISTRRA